jgi:hypothetical protein
MKKILVLCNHTTSEEIPAEVEYDEKININAYPPGQNLRLEIENITHRLLDNLTAISQDLLEIASYVYYADCSVSRGSELDVFAEKWKRKFIFFIPVSNPDLWNSQNVNGKIKDTLEFLSGDDFSFTFLPPRPTPYQLYIHFPDKPEPFQGADCISLFSGGLDSLIGSIYYLKDSNQRSVLVSHRSRPPLDSLQKALIGALKERFREWSFPHLSIWINRLGVRAVENTQRTRSFLFLSLAAVVAVALKINRISICENGVVSINIPISGQNIGTLLTRSTHPKFLNRFRELVQEIYTNNEISIENPFIFNTKTELLNMLKGWNQQELIQKAISCSYCQGRIRMKPQCGVCFQCVNRRFSVVASGLEEHDKVDYYEKDIFLQQLSEGAERLVPNDYVRTAVELNQMNENSFFEKYPELEDVIKYIDLPSSDQCAENIYGLFRRHAKEVMQVLKTKYIENYPAFLSGQLPDNCLISMANRRDHLIKPLDLYAEQIIDTLSGSLSLAFQSGKPTSEKKLQEVGEAVLYSAGERLQREAPMLSYSSVRTTPDFSNIRDFNSLLFIEFKLLKSRQRLNQIITEITSRITIYRDQGAYVLFVVYDTDRFIRNDDQFRSAFEKHDRIKARVLR